MASPSSPAVLAYAELRYRLTVLGVEIVVKGLEMTARPRQRIDPELKLALVTYRQRILEEHWRGEYDRLGRESHALLKAAQQAKTNWEWTESEELMEAHRQLVDGPYADARGWLGKVMDRADERGRCRLCGRDWLWQDEREDGRCKPCQLRALDPTPVPCLDCGAALPPERFLRCADCSEKERSA